IYTTFGIRWTELLCLPYWNPTWFVVVDCMHNFFISDLQHHCHNVLGLSTDSKPTKNPHTQLHMPEEQQRQLNAGINAIKIGSIMALTCLRRGYTVVLTNANNITPPIPTISNNPLVQLTKSDQTIGKTAYVQALIDWVSDAVMALVNFIVLISGHQYTVRDKSIAMFVRCDLLLM
ncbi:hypothetical protein F5J12DRAFT_713520, partial [Pisolithus orientalis]|uniref:uncharacterized protein n=1 Tax=Pisolithus orientalis TaxID=936130 RepID=UPI002224DFD0